MLYQLLSQKSLNDAIYSFNIKQNKRPAPALPWFDTREENRFQSVASEKKLIELASQIFTHIFQKRLATI